MRSLVPPLPAVLTLALLLTGCDRLGLEDPAKIAAAKEAEGKAVGAACRHAGRAIEDCYALNGKALKAAVFTGWKEMNDYMRENKIDAVTPQLAASAPKGGKPAEDGGEATSATADEKGKGKPSKLAEDADSRTQDEQSKHSKGSARSAKHG